MMVAVEKRLYSLNVIDIVYMLLKNLVRPSRSLGISDYRCGAIKNVF